MSRDMSLKQDLGRRSEPRTPSDRYHSVEVAVKGLAAVYQFKIWNISSKGMCILLMEDSVMLNHLDVGNILDMRYYPMEMRQPTEQLKTKIQHITREHDGKFKGRVLVGLSLVSKEEVSP